jgi:hypothetical protein
MSLRDNDLFWRMSDSSLSREVFLTVVVMTVKIFRSEFCRSEEGRALASIRRPCLPITTFFGTIITYKKCRLVPHERQSSRRLDVVQVYIRARLFRLLLVIIIFHYSPLSLTLRARSRAQSVAD